MTEAIQILLVDDELDFLETTSKRLTRRGHRVRTAASCAAAFAELATGWPQVVVLDVMLPDKDGILCLKEIKQAWPATVVILLTGHASMQAGLKSVEYGAHDYCLKPVEFDTLLEKIRIAWREGSPGR